MSVCVRMLFLKGHYLRVFGVCVCACAVSVRVRVILGGFFCVYVFGVCVCAVR